MGSGKKAEKYPYEPPVIYELQVDLKQAMGQTQCSLGTYASGACSVGQSPFSCQVGNAAGSRCADGGRPGTSCNAGGQPAM